MTLHALVLLVLALWTWMTLAFNVTRMPKGSGSPSTDERPFRSQGRLKEVMAIIRDEIMVEGPAGTGKSRAILEYIYALCILYPGIRVLIVRNTRHSLTESGLVTFEDHVVPRINGRKPKWLTNQMRRVRQAYTLPNGTEIVVGGCDNTDKFMSTEFDIIYVQEAREIEETIWEDLTSRLRNGKMPWQMIIGDTNPDGPTHWIKQRERSGKLYCIETRHEDNPVYYDEEQGALTPAGITYIGRLDNLTGVRHKRLRLGLWVGAEGLIYDEFDPAVHVVSASEFRRKVKPGWARDLTVDFGFTNAFAALLSAEDRDGRIYFYKELYGTQRNTIDWAHDIHDMLKGEPQLRSVITDHDKGERADLENHMGHGASECPLLADAKKAKKWTPTVVGTVPAIKTDEKRGIDLVQQRLKRAGDGFPRLFFVKGMLQNRPDERLTDSKQPSSTLEEIPRYVWAKARSLTAGEVTLEKPVDRWNHGCDCLRYRVMASDADLAPVTKMYGQSFQEQVA